MANSLGGGSGGIVNTKTDANSPFKSSPYSSGGGIGGAIGRNLGFDLTPGFNLTNPLASRGGAPATSAPAQKITSNGGQADNSGIYDASGNAVNANSTYSPADVAGYQTQLTDLNSLLGRTDTGLNQGLSQLGDSYQSNVNQQHNAENQALQDYGDQRTATNQDKLKAYDTINQNANGGYRSLAQLIGRASGSGSSAFQDLLPSVVGQDTSSKRGDANQTYATNLGNIDTAQKKTENSFGQILQDLANQRNAQEQSLRTGVENQRQGILQQQQTAAANLAAAKGGNAVAAASQYQPAIENSRNAVESFFNQFKPTVTAQQAAIAAPDLNQYTVDRSAVNAQQQGVPAGSDPYTAILRKQLQDSASGL